MNRKKFRRVICALLLLVTAAALLPGQALGETTTREILSGFGELVPVFSTPYLLAKEVKGKEYGLYNTDGEQLIPFRYAGLYYMGANCFCAVNEEPAKQSSKQAPTPEELNVNAIVTADGTQISGFKYGYLEVFDTYWACGWVLEKANYNDFDLTAGNDFHYRIERCDIYYLGDHALTGKKGTEELPAPLSLSRQEYQTAKSHGKYLYVQDRDEQIKVYDSQFNLVNVEVSSLDDPMYMIRNYSVVLRGTIDVLFDGFTAVKEVATDAGMLLKLTRLDYSGSKCSTVFTLDGEQLMPVVKGEIEALTKDYAVVTINKKRGLYSIKEQKVLAPCAFDKVIANGDCVDPYMQHGYVSVEKAKIRYFIDTADGTVYESPNPGKKWQRFGLLYVLNETSKSRFRITTPDQKTYDVKGAKPAKGQNTGSGYLMSFYSSSYKNMLVTWHGEILMKTYINPFTITSDDKAVVQKKDGTYSLLEAVSTK